MAKIDLDDLKVDDLPEWLRKYDNVCFDLENICQLFNISKTNFYDELNHPYLQYIFLRIIS